MSLPRRFLPSVASLRALEALDRLGSATAVAEELAQTQSAVSRQLQALEAQLGTTLVLREKKAMRLTPAAQDYAATIRDALHNIAQASLKLQINPQGGTLNLAILPTFGMRWLVPRLSEFARLHPEITINMTSRLKPFDFASQDMDAALHFGETDWMGADHLRLKSEMVVPVCAPHVLDTAQVSTAQDVQKLPLLHIETRPDAWSDWFEAQGVAAETVTGMLFDQFSTILQAAVHGLGVALLPDYLVEQDLATGKLVTAYGAPMAASGAYYLVWPHLKAREKALETFREWLATQSEDEDALPR